MFRLASCVAALVLACGLAPPAIETGRAQTLGDSVRRRAVKTLATGRLLIASRGLGDPNFSQTVVLLVEYGAEGAVGFILNRPSKVALSRVMPRFEQSAAGATTAFLGGPVVTAGSMAALTRSGDAGAGARRIVEGVDLVRSRERLEELIASGVGTNRLRVYLGYAGWGAGQLDDETAEGAWRIVDGQADLVFDPNPDTLWQRQIRRTEALSARLLRRLDGAHEPDADVR